MKARALASGIAVAHHPARVFYAFLRRRLTASRAGTVAILHSLCVSAGELTLAIRTADDLHRHRAARALFRARIADLRERRVAAPTLASIGTATRRDIDFSCLAFKLRLAAFRAPLERLAIHRARVAGSVAGKVARGGVLVAGAALRPLARNGDVLAALANERAFPIDAAHVPFLARVTGGRFARGGEDHSERERAGAGESANQGTTNGQRRSRVRRVHFPSVLARTRAHKLTRESVRRNVPPEHFTPMALLLARKPA